MVFLYAPRIGSALLLHCETWRNGDGLIEHRDRATDTGATRERPFLTAAWHQLLMLNYQVDTTLLAPYTPRGVEIDYWMGRTYVSLVGFRFRNTRVLGVPIPFHRNFDEVNLRFYVRRGDRRGVVFIREIVPRRAIAWVARTVYGENYVHLRMRHFVDLASVEYAWCFGGRWNRITASKLQPAMRLGAGSHEEFIAEHYWGYTRRSADRTLEYRVEHPPWQVRLAGAAVFEGSAAELYPREFEFLGSRPPDSAFVADGSAVSVSYGLELSA